MCYYAVGKRTTVSYGGSSSIAYNYDPLNWLTSMVDGLGATTFGYDVAGELLSAGGLWSGDTVAYAYTTRACAAVQLRWKNGGIYDSDWFLCKI